MATTDTDTTNLSSSVPQMYSHMAADYREANFLYVNLFDRKYESDLSEGDRVFIHGVSTFDAETSTQANELTSAAGTGGGRCPSWASGRAIATVAAR